LTGRKLPAAMSSSRSAASAAIQSESWLVQSPRRCRMRMEVHPHP
jgi:hypothetical protein